MSDSTLLDAALAYVETFDVPVFPCEPRGKRPFARLAPNGLKNATTDKATITKWWQVEPKANVGVLTGIAFDAFDIDAAGWSMVARLVNEHGSMALGPVAMTPNDGAHDLFLPTGVGNRAKFVDGCDWRGQNGYIIGVGSELPSGRYEWAIAPDEMELCEAPTWLVDLLTKRPEPISVQPGRAVNADAYPRRALEGEVGRVALSAEGTRNDALNRASFAVGTLIGAGLLDPAEAADALLIAAARCGLEETEARRTIASGFRAGALQPRKVAS